MADERQPAARLGPGLFYGRDKEDATAHFYNYQDYVAEQVRVAPAGDAVRNAPAQIVIFKLTLRGAARRWIEPLQFASVDALKTAFLARFSSDNTREQDIESLADVKLRPDESVNDFTDRLTQAAARLQFADAFTKDWFIGGLPINMRLFVKSNNPTDLVNAVKYAREFERVSRGSAESAAVQLSVQNQNQNDLIEQLSLLVLQGNSGRTRSDSPYPGKRGNKLFRINEHVQYSDGARNDRPFKDRSRSPFRGDSRSGRSPNRFGRSPSPRRFDRGRSPGRFRGDRSPSRPWRDSRDSRSNRSVSRGRSSSRERYGDRRRYPSERSSRECWLCGKVGHFYRQCRESRVTSMQGKAQLQAMKRFVSDVEPFLSGVE